MSTQQPLDLGTQGGVLPAGRRKKRRATGGDVFNRRVKDLFHAHPALRRHGIAPKPVIVSLAPEDVTILLQREISNQFRSVLRSPAKAGHYSCSVSRSVVAPSR